jgi:PhnB protein
MADERMVPGPWSAGPWNEAWAEEVLSGAPRPELEARVRRQLERQVMGMAAERRKGTQMAQATQETAAGSDYKREGFTTVTPYITVQKIDEFMEFAKAAFDAEETFRARGGAGGFHCELRIGTSMLMAGGGGTYGGPWKPGALHVQVANCDQSYEKALAAGAESLYPPEDKPYGERQAGVKDPAGNMWFIATPFPGAPMMEGVRTVTPFVLRGGALGMIDFLKRAFAAREVHVVKSPDGKLVHASFWIGDGLIELGSADFGPGAFYLSVPDSDRAYREAMEAGATSVHPPADQPYGVRLGTVTDEWGTTWYLASPLAAA